MHIISGMIILHSIGKGLGRTGRAIQLLMQSGLIRDRQTLWWMAVWGGTDDVCFCHVCLIAHREILKLVDSVDLGIRIYVVV